MANRKIRQEINLLNREVRSSDSETTNFGEWVYIDVDNYNNPEFWFEVIGQNLDSDETEYFYLHSDDAMDKTFPPGTTDSTITLPVNTTSWTYKRSSTSFVPSYNQAWYWFGFGTTYVNESHRCKSAKIIILQDAAEITDTQTQIEVGAYELWADVATAETYYPLSEPKIWKYESSKFDPTPTFTFGFTALNENDMDTTRIALQESSDAAFTSPSTVTNSVVSFTSETVAYYESSAFTPTDGYYYRVVYTNDDTKYGGTIYNAKVIATQWQSEFPKFSTSGAYGAVYGGTGTSEAQAQNVDVAAGQGGLLSSIKLYLEKTNSPTDNIYIKITTSIGGTAITNGTSDDVAASGVTSGGGWVTFPFSTYPTLSASTEYFIELYRDGSRDDINYVYWYGNDNNEASGVGAYTKISGAWSSEASTLDYEMRIICADTPDITKFQTEYLLINEAQTSTGLQEYQTRYDPASWDDGNGGKPDFYHEHYTFKNQNAGDFETKLQQDPGGTPADVTGSSIMGPYITRYTPVDHFSTGSGGGGDAMYSGSDEGLGQSFTGDGSILDNVLWLVGRYSSPTGNVTCQVYAHSGTYGSNGVPTGSALATAANTLDSSKIPTSPQWNWYQFNFIGANRITLTNSTYYFVTVFYSGGDSSNYVTFYYVTGDPHSGNRAKYNGSSWSSYTGDFNFIVNGPPVAMTMPATAKEIDSYIVTNF